MVVSFAAVFKLEHSLVTSFHHNTAHSDQWCGSETPLLGTQQGRNSDIPTSPDLTVGLNSHSASQVVQHQSLVSLGKTQLPRKTGVLDGCPFGSTGTTVVTRNGDVIGLGLDYTAGNDANTNFRHKLDRDSSTRIGSFEIINELLKVLDRIDIVVRRRRDKSHTRSRVSSSTDRSRHLVTGKLTTLTRLSTLSHLDLKFIRVGEVVGSDAESTGSDLLYSRSSRVPYRLELHRMGEGLAVEFGPGTGDGNATLSVFTAFTSVGFSTETVHSESQSSVSLHGDGTVGHGTSDTSSDDLIPRFNLLNRNWGSVLKVELKKTTEGTSLDRLSRVLGVSVVRRLVLLSNGVLKLGDGNGVVDTHLGTLTVVVLSAFGLFIISTALCNLIQKTYHAGDHDRVSGGPSPLVELKSIHRKKLIGGTLHPRGSTNKAIRNNLLVKTENLKELSALVRSKC